MKAIISLLAMLALPLSAPAQDALKRDHHQMHQLHRDSKAYIGMLDDPKRDAYQKPHEVLTALAIKPGEVIADIGAGSGYFTFRLAHHVGDKGKVYAVDISPDMILHLNRRIRELKAMNVTVLSSRIRTTRSWPMRSIRSLLLFGFMAPHRESCEVPFADEKDAQTRRRDRHDRLP